MSGRYFCTIAKRCAVVGQGLEHHARVLVAGLEHEDRMAAHAVQRLADDLAVLAREGRHLGHVAGDQRRRAALREPGGVDLLVHVAQAARRDSPPARRRARRARGCRWYRCTRCRTAGPCASGSTSKAPSGCDRRLAQRVPVLRIGAHRQRAHALPSATPSRSRRSAAPGSAAPSRAPAPPAACARVVSLAYLIWLDRVHDHGQSHVAAHHYSFEAHRC